MTQPAQTQPAEETASLIGLEKISLLRNSDPRGEILFSLSINNQKIIELSGLGDIDAPLTKLREVAHAVRILGERNVDKRVYDVPELKAGIAARAIATKLKEGVDSYMHTLCEAKQAEGCRSGEYVAPATYANAVQAALGSANTGKHFVMPEQQKPLGGATPPKSRDEFLADLNRIAIDAVNHGKAYMEQQATRRDAEIECMP